MFQAFQISNLIREYIEVLQSSGQTDNNAAGNIQSIYGPGISALYQHQPPQRFNQEDAMYAMYGKTANTMQQSYQNAIPASLLRKPVPALIEDISV